jgi:hypothetical protein
LNQVPFPEASEVKTYPAVGDALIVNDVVVIPEGMDTSPDAVIAIES